MKRLLCCLALLTSLCFGQGNGYNSYQAGSFTTTTSGSRITQNTTILYHQITWTIAGAPAACTVAVDSSPDGTIWTPGGIITGQTCTANGQSAIVNAQANFVRVTVTALSVGGTLSTKYIGWSYNPTPGTGTGSVTNIATGDGLTGGPITTTGTISLVSVLQRDTGKSISPLNIGQIAGSQVWFPQSPVTTPVQAGFTATLTGGSFDSGSTYPWAYTVSSALGESLPSKAFSVNMVSAGCTSGSSCTLTMIAPTIPTGYTSWTAYSCIGVGCTLLKVASCTNLAAGANCTLTAGNASGAVEPTTNTAFIQPPSVQASECPVTVTPSGFIQTNDGTYHTQWGVEPSTANNNIGVLTDCRQHFFTDLGNPSSGFRALSAPISYNNSFMAINHDFGLLNPAVQNRALSIFAANPTGDTATRWGLEGLQIETDMNGHPAINGSPDGEWATLSLQHQDNSDANHTFGTYGTHVMRVHYFKAGAGVGTGATNHDLMLGIYQINNNTYTQPVVAAGLNWFPSGDNTTVANLEMVAVRNQFMTNKQITNGQLAMYSQGKPLGSNNYIIANVAGTSGGIPSMFNGTIGVQGIESNSPTGIPVNGALTVNSSVATAQASAPAIPTGPPTCSGGASQYSYKFVGVDSAGGQVATAAMSTTASCTNPLTVGNPVSIGAHVVSAANTLLNSRFVRIDVYRTAGPMATGLIGSLTCSAPNTFVDIGNGPFCSAFSDTGLAATTAVPAANTTGGISSVGYILGGLNTKRVATNFTTAANTNLQTITGLSWTTPPVAANYSFHCALAYSQATGAAAVAFGIQAATVAPTNIFAKGRQQITVGPPATYVSGTLATLATTTATNIVSGTPGATATNYEVELDGTLELPAGENAINIMVSTATSGDAVTVLQGSYCSILP